MPTKREQGLGASSLPNRNYLKQQIERHMRKGIELSPTQVWFDMPNQVQVVIEAAYGSIKDAQVAVQRSLQNSWNLNGNPRKLRGRGRKAIYVYHHESDKEARKAALPPIGFALEDGDIVYTTETPDPFEGLDAPIPETIVKTFVGPYDIPEKPQTYVSESARRRTEALIEAAVGPQVGDTKTYTLVGKFLDGTFLWREESTGHVGSIEFTAL